MAIAAIALQTALFGTLSGPLADLGLGDAVVRGRDMRAWGRNSVPPMYYGPAVGLRCARQEKE